MKMQSPQEDRSGDNINEDTSSNRLCSPDSPDGSDICVVQKKLPRVGDRFQVEIPHLLLANPQSGDDHSFSVGLPIPVMWIKSVVEKECTVEDCRLAPSSSHKPWSNIEQESFLLGLYIFGKNLIRIKSFVETKEMGDLLAFYYGKFYRSEYYHRWSECKKKKMRRCVYGRRIFTGWRQQELLSRLLPRVSEECRSTLLEVSRTFEERKTSLELYISTLKSTVGIELILEAVGIGKGKKLDLTAKVVEPAKAKVKSYFSLTTGDIIKFLKGDTRFSMARSNDLFWDAVWPRLLANGWHLEQPKSQIYACPKRSLVFLIPGVKKFSRRRLMKGEEYFDTITDVLNRIASEPSFLEIQIEEAKDSGNNGTRTELDKKGHSDEQCHASLHSMSDHMQFTIVEGEEPLSIQKLRTLPVDIANTDISGVLLNDQAGTADISSSTKGIYHRVASPDSLCSIFTASKQGIPIDGLDSSSELDNFKNDSRSMSYIQENKAIEHEFSHREKVGQFNCLEPVRQQPSLDACSHEAVSQSTKDFKIGTALEEGEHEFSHTRIPMDEQQPDIISRRKSTRIRPLTTKAREALESNLLLEKRRRKHTVEATSEENLQGNPPRKARRKVSHKTHFGNLATGILESKVGEALEEGYNSQARTERVFWVRS